MTFVLKRGVTQNLNGCDCLMFIVDNITSKEESIRFIINTLKPKHN